MDSSSTDKYVHPHVYWRLFDARGEQYGDCGTEEMAQRLVELNAEVQKLTYKRIDPPKPLPPQTVNVDAERLEDEKQLKAQKVLPESELELFNENS